MKVILITGASGFIGSRLCRCLTEKGYTVIGVGKREHSLFSHSRFEWVQMDLSKEEVPSAFSTADMVVHAAAKCPVSFEDDLPVADVNWRIDNTVLNCCNINQLPLIYTSSTALYATNGDKPKRETDKINPRAGYPKEKEQFEILGHQWQLKTGIPFTSLRISAPYGPDQQTATVLHHFVRKALNTEPVSYHGSGNREQDFTYIDDVVTAIQAAFHSKGGVYNIASGQPVTMKRLAEMIVEETNSASCLGPSGQSDLQEGHTARYDISHAKEELNWQPITPLQEGLKTVARWHKPKVTSL